MPDGEAASRIVYGPARRKNVGVLIMLAGPPGAGKTLSALMLAKGLAGPGGKVAICDTENERALYYANREFDFGLYYSLHEPFRPSRFEEAAVAAQKQGATVWVCDSFSAEHTGPGGMLDYFEAELQRMAGDDYGKRERMKAAAWIKPKGEHKRMLQRLWQLNMHVILCCQAERKTALMKIEEGPKRGKIEFVDLGYQPICGGDIPYAMTTSFMFDTKAPGVPIVIKPLLPDLVPIIDLKNPISEATGERMGAWARGDAPAAASMSDSPKPSAEETPAPPPPRRPPQRSEAEIEAGAKALVEKFKQTADRQSHLALTHDRQVAKQIDWLSDKMPKLYAETVEPAIKESWRRTDPDAVASQEPPSPSAKEPDDHESHAQ